MFWYTVKRVQRFLETYLSLASIKFHNLSYCCDDALFNIEIPAPASTDPQFRSTKPQHSHTQQSAPNPTALKDLPENRPVLRILRVEYI